MSKIPLGIHHFPDLIKEGYTYVDKTHLIYQFIQMRPGCFIARPRRFGKSLLVSALEALFQGRRELFKGLWIETSDYQWKEHPIIRIDWTSAELRSKHSLEVSLMAILKSTAEKYGIEDIEREYPVLTFTALVEKLHRKIGQSVVLIDEYDQPLNQHIEDPQQAEEIRKILKNFYANMKSQERYIRFIFVTGVSQFTKVSLFSGLNNINMLSFRPDFNDGF